MSVDYLLGIYINFADGSFVKKYIGFKNNT